MIFFLENLEHPLMTFKPRVWPLSQTTILQQCLVLFLTWKTSNEKQTIFKKQNVFIKLWQNKLRMNFHSIFDSQKQHKSRYSLESQEYVEILDDIRSQRYHEKLKENLQTLLAM